MSRRGNRGLGADISVAATSTMSSLAAERAIVLLARWAGNRAKRSAGEVQRPAAKSVTLEKVNGYRRRNRKK
jgi:hypothetical protein